MIQWNGKKHVHGELLCTEALEYMQWVETLEDGRLFTIMSVGKPDGARNYTPCSQFLFGRISDDNGKTWNTPYYLYTWPNQKTAFCMQGWKSDSDGRIHVFASGITKYDCSDMSNAKLEGHIAYVRFDSYRGENPYYSDIPALPRYTGSLNNAIELNCGRLVVPFSTYLGGKFVSNTIWSDDHGDTWNASNDVRLIDEENNCESGAVEPVVAQVDDNTLVMLIRTVNNYLYYAVSYDKGETWSEAFPTKIPSSNAPATIQKLPDGRFFIAWNNCLGQPMHGVRYSAARQCLHGAISDDGLRTFHGARIVVKKEAGDKDRVQNTYPTTALANEQEILLKHFEVDGKEGSNWRAIQAFLLKLNPDFLMETEVHDNWNEWITELPQTEKGICFQGSIEQPAHAIGNFPYAESGTMVLSCTGDSALGCRILLSDCYFDRANFLQNARTEQYKELVGMPYDELTPNTVGEWKIIWDKESISLFVNDVLTETVKKSRAGYNHVSIVVHGEGSVFLKHFDMEAIENKWETSIVY